MVEIVKVPITPKTFLAGLNLCIVLSKMPQKVLDLVKIEVEIFLLTTE